MGPFDKSLPCGWLSTPFGPRLRLVIRRTALAGEGATLRVDPISKNIYLVHEIDATNRYTHFRFLIADFVSLAQEWRTIFDDLSSRDLQGIQ